jgi:hypothetical protein
MSKPAAMDKIVHALQKSSTTTTTSSLTTSMSTSTTAESASVLLKPENSNSSDKILPSPATLYAITKKIENSFKESSTLESPTSVGATSIGSPSNVSRFTFSGSLNKILSQPYQYKSSPSNSVKSNSAPGRVSSARLTRILQ